MQSSVRSLFTLVMAVLCSGAASLVYQVVWTRSLISMTRATSEAQGLVLAIFMAGLGLGAWLAGRSSSQWKRPLQAYALVEGLAALCSLVSISLFGQSEWLRTFLFHSLGIPLSLGVWIQLGVLALFLLIPTTLLGMSIPLVLEFAQRHLFQQTSSSRTFFIGTLYGFNTLGAALGCLFAGYYTIEYIGLQYSIWLGCALGIAAALLGLLLHSWYPATLPAEPPRATLPEEEQRIEPLFFWLAGLSGAIGLAAEVLWTRMVALFVLNTVYAFTQVLAAVLVGIACGGYLVSGISYLGRAKADPRAYLLRWIVLLQLGTVCWMIALPWFALWIAGQNTFFATLAQGKSLYSFALLFTALAPPSACIAATLPLFVSASKVSNASYALGILYASNAFGSVLGSFAMGFLFLPYLGMDLANSLLVCSALLLVVGILLHTRDWKWLLPTLAAGIGLFLSVRAIQLPQDIYKVRIPANEKLLGFYQGKTSDVLVTETQGGLRYIWINSSWVASSGGEHHLLGHLPALLAPHSKRALGIAMGTGQTFAAIVKHPFQAIDCVDLNKGVLYMAKKWFGAYNKGLFGNPRVTIHRDDGRAFMRSSTRHYDLLVLEPLQAWSVGTTSLYTKEFYQEALRVLAPGGILAQWIPFYGQGLQETKSMVKTALAVFPHASLWYYKKDGILLLQKEPNTFSLKQFQQRIEQRQIAKEFQKAHIERSEEILAFFLATKASLLRWAGTSEILRDDRPFLEFSAARQLQDIRFSRVLPSLVPFVENPYAFFPGVASEKKRETQIKQLRAALMAIDASTSPAQQWKIYERAMKEIPTSSVLRGRLLEHTLEQAESARTAAAQESIYKRGLRLDPHCEKALINLSILLANRRAFRQASSWLGQIPTHSPVYPRARKLITMFQAAEKSLQRPSTKPHRR